MGNDGKHLFTSEEAVLGRKKGDPTIPETTYSRDLRMLVDRMLQPQEVLRPDAHQIYLETMQEKRQVDPNGIFWFVATQTQATQAKDVVISWRDQKYQKLLLQSCTIYFK